MAKAIGHPNPRKVKTKILKQYLLKNEKKVLKHLNNKSSFWKENKSIIVSVILFILTTSIGYYWFKSRSPKPIMFDSQTTNITLVQNIKKGELLSLTYFEREDPNFTNFENYSNSLAWIDRLQYRMDLSELNLKPNLKKFNPEFIYKVIEYSFWRWMMNMSQAYIIIGEHKRKSIKNSKSGTVTDPEQYDITDTVVPAYENELIELKKPQIFLPRNAKFYKENSFYIIETENSLFRFSVPSTGFTDFNYSENELSKKIYNLLEVEESIRLYQINSNIYMDYKRLDSDINNELANFEYEWFKRLMKNVEEDFAFENIQEKILEIE